jgi:adenosylcobinamide kinase / adenosylcobinamide-phosphate guanylyltransferase
MIIFISGGARSGKSALAEQLAYDLQKRASGSGSPPAPLDPARHVPALHYVATAKRSDQEMRDRIYLHQKRRGDGWITHEAPHHPEQVLFSGLHHAGDIYVLDCVTIWISQLMYDIDWDRCQIEDKVRSTAEVFRRQKAQAIIVSNDVNEGIPPAAEEVAHYIAVLESAHRLLCAEADEVWQVKAGLPIVWKAGAESVKTPRYAPRDELESGPVPGHMPRHDRGHKMRSKFDE